MIFFDKRLLAQVKWMVGSLVTLAKPDQFMNRFLINVSIIAIYVIHTVQLNANLMTVRRLQVENTHAGEFAHACE